MRKDHIEKLRFLLAHSDVSNRKPRLSLLMSLANSGWRNLYIDFVP